MCVENPDGTITCPDDLPELIATAIANKLQQPLGPVDPRRQTIRVVELLLEKDKPKVAIILDEAHFRNALRERAPDSLSHR
jgi:hypothetical protein